MTKQCWWSNVNDDGNDGNGGDGNGNSNGDGNSNGNDAAASANGYNVNEDNSGNLRTAIGWQQLDNDNGMTIMWLQ
jgi:hypothetical protein